VKLAKNPAEVEMVESRVKQLESIQALGAQSGYGVTAQQQGEVTLETAEKVVADDPKPAHPTEPPNGPKHVATGVIQGVKCSFPAILEFQVKTGRKTVLLYTNDFMKIDLSVVGFTPKGDVNPCADFDGMKAEVQYAETSDKTVDGQVIAVLLRK